MKQLLYFFCAVFFIPSVFFAQNEQQPGKFTVKLSPFSFADPYTACVQPGMEYKLTARWGFQVEYGLRLRAGHTNEDRYHYRYHKWRSEGRYYFDFGRRSGFSNYLALEGFIVPQRYGKLNDFYRKETSWYSFESADVKRTIRGYCVKAGKQFFLDTERRWLIETSFGFGVREIKVKHNNVKGLQPTSDPRQEYGFNVGDNFEGKEAAPHLSLNLRIGYVLGSRNNINYDK